MASEHIVKSFDDELRALRGIITEMGGLVGSELQAALDAFANRDADAAAAATVTDEAVNQLEHDIEELAVRMIATRQPMADDLRAIIAGLRASGDLERVGDQAKNIANRVFTLVELPPCGAEAAVLELGSLVNAMVSDAVDAYVEKDVGKAEAVRARDAEIDRRYTGIFSEILSLNAEDARRATVCTHLNLIVRSIERIGDLATDVAEEAIFMASGRIPKDDRSKADESFFVTQADE